MKKRIILLLLLILTLTACNKNNETVIETEETQAEEVVNSIITDGEKVYKDVPKDKKVIEWYSDPACGGCLDIVQMSNDFLPELLKENNLVVRHHYLNFLDESKEGYSTKIASLLLYLSENYPDKYSKIQEEVFSMEYAQINYSTLGINTIKNLLEKHDIKIDDTKKLEQDLKDKYNQITKYTESVINDEELSKKSPFEEGIFTPFIIMPGKDKAEDLSEVKDVKSHFTKVIKELK